MYVMTNQNEFMEDKKPTLGYCKHEKIYKINVAQKLERFMG